MENYQNGTSGVRRNKPAFEKTLPFDLAGKSAMCALFFLKLWARRYWKSKSLMKIFQRAPIFRRYLELEINRDVKPGLTLKQVGTVTLSAKRPTILTANRESKSYSMWVFATIFWVNMVYGQCSEFHRCCVANMCIQIGESDPLHYITQNMSTLMRLSTQTCCHVSLVTLVSTHMC